jgi:hypothetical protein
MLMPINVKKIILLKFVKYLIIVELKISIINLLSKKKVP